MNLGSFGEFTVTYGFHFDYFTAYHAGQGPYYDVDNGGTTIYSQLTSADHYEEYGMEGHLHGTLMFSLGTGSNNNDGWIGDMLLNLDILTIKPYR